MAVPKKKRSKSRQGMLWAHKKVSYDNLVACGHCDEWRRSHHMCTACGYYQGRQVIVPKKQKRAEKSVED